MSDEKRLRELADSAETCAPSPWKHVRVRFMQHEVHGPGESTEGEQIALCESDATAAFIAAANPATVLALLDRIASLSKEVERVRDALIVSQGNESRARNERDDARAALSTPYKLMIAARDTARQECERLRGELATCCNTDERDALIIAMRRALRAALATWCPRDPGGNGADGDTYRLVTDALDGKDRHGNIIGEPKKGGS